MKDSGHEPGRLRELLRQAYREKENIQVGGQWERNLMSRVRDLTLTESSPGFLPVFAQLVWRVAAVTCPLTVGLLALLVKLDFILGNDVVQLLSGTEEAMFAQLFGG